MIVAPISRDSSRINHVTEEGIYQGSSNVHTNILPYGSAIGMYPPGHVYLLPSQGEQVLANSINSSSFQNPHVPEMKHEMSQAYRMYHGNTIMPQESTGSFNYRHPRTNFPIVSNFSSSRILPLMPRTAIEPKARRPILPQGPNFIQMRHRADEIFANLGNGETCNEPGRTDAFVPQITAKRSFRIDNPRRFLKRMSTLRRLCRKAANKAFFSNDKIQVRHISSIISTANPWISEFAPNEPEAGQVFRDWVNMHREAGADWREEFPISSKMITELRRWNLIIKNWSAEAYYRARLNKYGLNTNTCRPRIERQSQIKYESGSESSEENELLSEASNVVLRQNYLEKDVLNNSAQVTEVSATHEPNNSKSYNIFYGQESQNYRWYQESDVQAVYPQGVSSEVVEISEDPYSPLTLAGSYENLSLPLFEVSSVSEISQHGFPNKKPGVALVTIWRNDANATSWEHSDHCMARIPDNGRQIPQFSTD